MVMELGWKVGAVFSYMVLMLLSFVYTFFDPCTTEQEFIS